MRVSVVIPTKNEEATIGQIIAELQSWAQQKQIDLGIFVTDDSTDLTRSKAKAMGAQVVIAGGKGLGQAMFRGLRSSLEHSPDYIISLDGDGQVDLRELDVFLQPLLADRADLVIGSRFRQDKLVHYRYRVINRLGVRMLTWILRLKTGLDITDSHGGIRAMRPEVVRQLELIGTHTYVQEAIIDAYENGFRIVELPSAWLPRKFGTSKVVFSIPKYIFYTLPVLILRTGSHVRLLFPAGLFFVLFSIGEIIWVAVATGFSLRTMLDRHSFHLFFLLLSVGINLFFFGFTLEMISYIKRKVS